METWNHNRERHGSYVVLPELAKKREGLAAASIGKSVNTRQRGIALGLLFGVAVYGDISSEHLARWHEDFPDIVQELVATMPKEDEARATSERQELEHAEQLHEEQLCVSRRIAQNQLEAQTRFEEESAQMKVAIAIRTQISLESRANVLEKLEGHAGQVDELKTEHAGLEQRCEQRVHAIELEMSSSNARAASERQELEHALSNAEHLRAEQLCTSKHAEQNHAQVRARFVEELAQIRVDMAARTKKSDENHRLCEKLEVQIADLQNASESQVERKHEKVEAQFLGKLAQVRAELETRSKESDERWARQCEKHDARIIRLETDVGEAESISEEQSQISEERARICAELENHIFEVEAKLAEVEQQCQTRVQAIESDMCSTNARAICKQQTLESAISTAGELYEEQLRDWRRIHAEAEMRFAEELDQVKVEMVARIQESDETRSRVCEKLEDQMDELRTESHAMEMEMTSSNARAASKRHELERKVVEAEVHVAENEQRCRSREHALELDLSNSNARAATTQFELENAEQRFEEQLHEEQLGVSRHMEQNQLEAQARFEEEIAQTRADMATKIDMVIAADLHLKCFERLEQQEHQELEAVISTTEERYEEQVGVSRNIEQNHAKISEELTKVTHNMDKRRKESEAYAAEFATLQHRLEEDESVASYRDPFCAELETHIDELKAEHAGLEQRVHAIELDMTSSTAKAASERQELEHAVSNAEQLHEEQLRVSRHLEQNQIEAQARFEEEIAQIKADIAIRIQTYVESRANALEQLEVHAGQVDELKTEHAGLEQRCEQRVHEIELEMSSSNARAARECQELEHNLSNAEQLHEKHLHFSRTAEQNHAEAQAQFVDELAQVRADMVTRTEKYDESCGRLCVELEGRRAQIDELKTEHAGLEQQWHQRLHAIELDMSSSTVRAASERQELELAVSNAEQLHAEQLRTAKHAEQNHAQVQARFVEELAQIRASMAARIIESDESRRLCEKLEGQIVDLKKDAGENQERYQQRLRATELDMSNLSERALSELQEREMRWLQVSRKSERKHANMEAQFLGELAQVRAELETRSRESDERWVRQCEKHDARISRLETDVGETERISEEHSHISEDRARICAELENHIFEVEGKLAEVEQQCQARMQAIESDMSSTNARAICKQQGLESVISKANQLYEEQLQDSRRIHAEAEMRFAEELVRVRVEMAARIKESDETRSRVCEKLEDQMDELNTESHAMEMEMNNSNAKAASKRHELESKVVEAEVHVAETEQRCRSREHALELDLSTSNARAATTQFELENAEQRFEEQLRVSRSVLRLDRQVDELSAELEAQRLTSQFQLVEAEADAAERCRQMEAQMIETESKLAASNAKVVNEPKAEVDQRQLLRCTEIESEISEKRVSEQQEEIKYLRAEVVKLRTRTEVADRPASSANVVAADTEDDGIVCSICNSGDDGVLLLLCDSPGCNIAAHCYCDVPRLSQVPQGSWYCQSCRGASHAVSQKNKRQTRRIFVANKIQDIAMTDEDIQEKIVIANLSGKGRCLIGTKQVRKGSVIFREAPIIKVTPDASDSWVALQKLSSEKKLRFHPMYYLAALRMLKSDQWSHCSQLYFDKSQKMDNYEMDHLVKIEEFSFIKPKQIHEAVLRWRYNAYEYQQTGLCLYRWSSIMAHSSKPTCDYSVRPDGVYELKAKESLAPYTELTIMYVSADQVDRLHEWGIRCDCGMCTCGRPVKKTAGARASPAQLSGQLDILGSRRHLKRYTG